MATAKFIQTGDSIDYTPGSAVTAGDVVVQEELVGVAKLDIVANVLGALAVVGYTLYEFVRELYVDSDVPLPVQLGIGAVALGMIVLVGTVLVDRLRRRKRERLGEVEY